MPLAALLSVLLLFLGVCQPMAEDHSTPRLSGGDWQAGGFSNKITVRNMIYNHAGGI